MECFKSGIQEPTKIKLYLESFQTFSIIPRKPRKEKYTQGMNIASLVLVGRRPDFCLHGLLWSPWNPRSPSRQSCSSSSLLVQKLPCMCQQGHRLSHRVLLDICSLSTKIGGFIRELQGPGLACPLLPSPPPAWRSPEEPSSPPPPHQDPSS